MTKAKTIGTVRERERERERELYFKEISFCCCTKKYIEKIKTETLCSYT